MQLVGQGFLYLQYVHLEYDMHSFLWCCKIELALHPRHAFPVASTIAFWHYACSKLLFMVATYVPFPHPCPHFSPVSSHTITGRT